MSRGTSVITLQKCLTSFPATAKEQQQREQEEEGNVLSLSAGVCIFQMWNVGLPLSLPPYRVFLYPQRRSKVSPTVRQICSAVANSYSMPHFLRMHSSRAAHIGKWGLLES